MSDPPGRQANNEGVRERESRQEIAEPVQSEGKRYRLYQLISEAKRPERGQQQREHENWKQGISFKKDEIPK